jgi:hypothetical protein
VESQVPETLERAFLVARVQQEVLDETKSKGNRSMFQNHTTEAAKPDTAKKNSEGSNKGILEGSTAS